MYGKMAKSGLISGGHIRPGPDIAGYENLAGFRPGPGPDMISGATLVIKHRKLQLFGHIIMQDAKSSSREAGNAGNYRWQSSSTQTNTKMVRRHRRLVRLHTPGSCSHGKRPGQVEDNHWPQRPTWVISSQREREAISSQNGKI